MDFPWQNIFLPEFPHFRRKKGAQRAKRVHSKGLSPLFDPNSPPDWLQLVPKLPIYPTDLPIYPEKLNAYPDLLSFDPALLQK